MTTREISREQVLVGTLKEMLHVQRLPSRSTQEQQQPDSASSSPKGFLWAGPTIEKILDLPWNEENWQQGALAPSTNAASQLLVALSTTLLPDSPAPDIGPMWDGGVCAEWHQNGIDLELYVAPDGNATWSFEDLESGEEQEEESGQPVWQLPDSKFRDHIVRLGPARVPNED